MILKKNAPEKISYILEGLLENTDYSYFAMEKSLNENWASIVGERIAEIAKVDDFTPPVVKIKVEIPAWKMEISFLELPLIILVILRSFQARLVLDLRLNCR